MGRASWTVILLLSLGACSSVRMADQSNLRPPSIDGAAGLAAADATRADGRLTEAVQIYQQVLVADPHSIAAQYGMAESLLGLGHASDAKPIFAALTKNQQFRAGALQGVGIADLALRKYEEAATSLSEAVSADPKLWRAYNGLGFIADLQRQPQEAAELYGKALALNPDSAALLNNRGYSLLISGKPDDALADLKKALGLEPRSETIQNNLRLAMAEKGNYAEATRGLARDRQSVVLNNVGFVAMRRGDLAAAEAMLARAMTGNSSYDAVTAHNLDQLASLKADGK